MVLNVPVVRQMESSYAKRGDSIRKAASLPDAKGGIYWIYLIYWKRWEEIRRGFKVGIGHIMVPTGHFWDFIDLVAP